MDTRSSNSSNARTGSTRSRSFQDATTAWVLNDDDWNREWMDEELALIRYQQQERKSNVNAVAAHAHNNNEALHVSTTLTQTLTSRRDSESSYQRTFGKKRRPSLSSGRSNSNKTSLSGGRAPMYSNRKYDNDNDSSTISTVSSSNSNRLHDDRDTDVSISNSSLRDERHHRYDDSIVGGDNDDNDDNDDERAGEEIDQVVQKLLYKCNITVVNNPFIPKVTEELPSKANVPSPTTASNATTNATTIFTPPKIRKNHNNNNNVSSRSSTTTRTGKKGRRKKKKTVSFHKYDKLIYSSNQMEYVYSLYSYEIEREKKEYDVVDEIENAMNDVGYFFHCLQKSITENVVSVQLEEQEQQRHRYTKRNGDSTTGSSTTTTSSRNINR